MAITFEGTYRLGPDGVNWNTQDDYRQCGEELGLAIFDQLGLSLTASVTNYGVACSSLMLAAGLLPQANGSHIALLAITSGPSSGLAVLVAGSSQAFLPLPQPWANCALLTPPDATLVLLLNQNGAAGQTLMVPAMSGLLAYLQAVSLDAALGLDASNGICVQNNY